MLFFSRPGADDRRQRQVFGDASKNYSTNPDRRVDRTAQPVYSVDTADAVSQLKAALAKIPNGVAKPRPDVEIIHFTTYGPVLALRPYCHTDHYSEVYFDPSRTIFETFDAAGYPGPETRTVMQRAASCA